MEEKWGGGQKKRAEGIEKWAKNAILDPWIPKKSLKFSLSSVGVREFGLLKIAPPPQIRKIDFLSLCRSVFRCGHDQRFHCNWNISIASTLYQNKFSQILLNLDVSKPSPKQKSDYGPIASMSSFNLLQYVIHDLKKEDQKRKVTCKIWLLFKKSAIFRQIWTTNVGRKFLIVSKHWWLNRKVKLWFLRVVWFFTILN